MFYGLHGRTRALSLAVAFLLAGCGAESIGRQPCSVPPATVAFVSVVPGPSHTRIEYAPKEPPPRRLQPRPPQLVALFESDLPKRPFVEVGVFESRETRAPESELQKLRARVRIHAGFLGCDGLVLAAGSAGEVLSPGDRTYRATCIVFRGTDRDAPPLEPDGTSFSVPVAPDGPSSATSTGATVTEIGDGLEARQLAPLR